MMECTLSDVTIDSEEGVISDYSEKPSSSVLHSDVHNKKQKRKVILCTDKKNETLIITHEAKKNKTAKTDKRLVDNKMEMEREYCKEEIKITKSDRIVPDCSRVKCNRRARRRSRHEVDRRTRRKEVTCKRKSKTKQSNYNTKKMLKEGSESRSLSSILSSSLISLQSDTKEKFHISYEDVSSDSFTSQGDSELDTLIKRTKEREKHMTLSSSFLSDQPKSTSTPQTIIDLCSEDTLESKGDVSVHSKRTFVLGDQVHDLTHSPIRVYGREAGSLLHTDGKDRQANEGPVNKSSRNTNLLELIPDIKTGYSVGPDHLLNYYQYYNESNNNECNFKNENNNDICPGPQILQSKKSHNG